MDRRAAAVHTMRQRHPQDATLFGDIGAYAAELSTDVLKDLENRRYVFMDNEKFRSIRNVEEVTRIYWTEMLYRVHWCATLSVMRHRRWQTGCIRAFEGPSNLLGFASSLRGLLESSLDANYSLLNVPATLADAKETIEASLKGTQQQVVLCSELEDRPPFARSACPAHTTPSHSPQPAKMFAAAHFIS